jgi:NAD(P)-dependent dehydrogenase (short-subunit alcohol dehydrogenase family)
MTNVNVFGLICMCQHYIPFIRESGGRIINVGSLAGLVSAQGMGPYNGSKHFVETITDSYRYELKEANISVSIIEPGMVRTPMFEKDTATQDLMKTLSPELLKVYEPHLLMRTKNKEKTFEHAPGPEVTTEAIKHAMFDSYPKTRYPISNFKGNPAWVVATVFKVVPFIFGDRVLDHLVNKSPSTFHISTPPFFIFCIFHNQP